MQESKPSFEGYFGSAKTASVNYDVVFYVPPPVPPPENFASQNS